VLDYGRSDASVAVTLDSGAKGTIYLAYNQWQVLAELYATRFGEFAKVNKAKLGVPLGLEESGANPQGGCGHARRDARNADVLAQLPRFRFAPY